MTDGQRKLSALATLKFIARQLTLEGLCWDLEGPLRIYYTACEAEYPHLQLVCTADPTPVYAIQHVPRPGVVEEVT